MPTIADLKQRFALIDGLQQAGTSLSWDQDTQMPPGGAPGRARALGAVSLVVHELSTDDAFRALLEGAEAAAEPLDDADQRLLAYAREEYDKQARLPASFVGELREATATANQVWKVARRENDFARLAPHLERVVALQRERAEKLGYDDHPYDALLDRYESGMTTAEVRAIFATLRDATVPLVRAIAAREPVDDSMLRQPFDEATQWALAHEVAALVGYDFERGRIDRSAHPYCATFGVGDVRMTTRTDPTFFNTCFFATLHETGHGLYNQGLPESLARTPLFRGASAAVHESQSRLWENLIGRSRPFWRYYYPEVQARFPEALGEVPMEPFYRAVNRVEPSLIRIEADEITYNLHIMLRFELELALLEGEISVAELPARWNERMEEYLGVVPPTDANGVMQDMHWPAGLFGYFPTYTLGNVLAAQLWEAAAADLGDIGAQIERGDFMPILGWMREHVHRHGRLYKPQELIERVTGRTLTAEPYLAYLREKFGDIYGI